MKIFVFLYFQALSGITGRPEPIQGKRDAGRRPAGKDSGRDRQKSNIKRGERNSIIDMLLNATRRYWAICHLN